jgi:type I pantothenate kinase
MTQSAADAPFVPLDREAWARAGGAEARDLAAACPPSVEAGWGEGPREDPDGRAAVLAPLARYAAARREQDLRRRAALAELHPALVRGGAGARGWVVAVGGGVAVGKTTVGRELALLLQAAGCGPVARVATDDFLLPNAELEERGLAARKGFPESYDGRALIALLDAVRSGDGPVRVPTYSHRLQDRVEGGEREIDRPAVLVLEGLRSLAGPEAESGLDGVDAPAVRDRVDLGIYVDAPDELLQRWYLDRFHAWRVAAAVDPGARLHAIAEMPDDEVDALAMRVWHETNAPNIRDHVLPTRAHADVVLEKDADHRVRRVLVRPV